MRVRPVLRAVARDPGWVRWAGPAAAALAVLLVALPAGPGPGAPALSIVRTAVTGPCLGPAIPGLGEGTLSRIGNSSPSPSVDDVGILVAYFYQELERNGSGIISESCIATETNGTTSGGGGFSVPLPIPPSGCVGPICHVVTGPYGPIGFAVPRVPAGYSFAEVAAGPGPAVLEWVANLDTAELDLAFPTTVVSVGAPLVVGATAHTAHGAPSPGPLSYTWRLSGLGWEDSPSADGTHATVEATPGAWNASLTAEVAGIYNGTQEWANSTTAVLVPVPTRILGGAVSRTTVDVGVPLNLTILGSGAAGYPYRVTLLPGLGTPAVAVPCASTLQPNGTVGLVCATSIIYLANGTTVPTAELTNGFSATTSALPALTVRPGVGVELSAAAPTAYPIRPVDVTVRVVSGTGSPPFGPACLDPGLGTGATCATTAGTTWEFPVLFPAPGRYQLRATVLDVLGRTGSASVTYTIVPALVATAVGSTQLSTFIGRSTNLSVNLTGGALPLAYWWNLSQPAQTLQGGVLPFDAAVALWYSPSILGAVDLTLTVRDALGSTRSVTFQVVGVAPSPLPTPRAPSVPNADLWILPTVALGTIGALVTGVLIRVRFARRRDQREAAVDEEELHRIAEGRAHLLARADPELPRPAADLRAGWTGADVPIADWMEWIAALVMEGALLPETSGDGGLAYRRARGPSRPPTIDFDPDVWAAAQAGDDPEPPDADPRDQGGG